MTAPPPYSSAGYPVPGGPYTAPAPRRNHKLLSVGVVLAILIAAAALSTGIVLLARPAPAPPATSPPPTTPDAHSTGNTTAADRALCASIAPLMGESDTFTNSYMDVGEPGSPAWDAATPKFITSTQDWIRRIQPLVDANPDVDPYFQRSLQRFIDDRHLLVVDLTPGPLTPYARALYEDSVGAYSGPLHVCDGLGVKW